MTLLRVMSRHQRWAVGSLFAVAEFALSLAAVVLGPSHLSTAVWWPAAGLAVAVVARRWQDHRVLIVVVVVATGLANWVGGRGVGVAAGFAVANGCEAWVAARVLTSRRPGLKLMALHDVWRLMAAAGAGASVIATGAAVTVVVFGDGGFWSVWRLVAVSHGASVLIVAPLFMQVARRRAAGTAERVAQWFVLAGVLFAVFAPAPALPLAFLVLPAAVWGALRSSVRTVTRQLLLIACMTVLFTSEHSGPFVPSAGSSRSPSIVGALTQAFLVSTALVLLPLAIVVAQRASAMARISSREDMFRHGFNRSLLGMMLLRRSGGVLRVVEINQQAAEMLALTPEQIIDQDWWHIVRGDASREGEHPDGSWRSDVPIGVGPTQRWLDISVSPLRSIKHTEMFTVQLVDVTDRRETEASLAHRASSDGLTGLVNRSHFLEQLAERLGMATRSDTVALLFVDLDDFKYINDSAGHRTGDAVLVEVARRLAAVTRPDDLLARFGGDEFVLMCVGLACARDAERLAGELIEAVGDTVVVDGINYPVGLSIGIALNTPGRGTDDLMSNADTAMYASKAAGKHRTTVFAEAHRVRAIRTVRLQPELRRALELNQFVVHVQPIVDLASGAIIGGEALVRWQHPTDGLLEPDEWIDIAESTGLMPVLGAWIMGAACQIAAAWPDATDDPRPRRIHVNVSARQLDSGDFGHMVEAALRSSHLAPDRLTIELTETHLARIHPEVLADLHALVATGVCLAADDFGTGYSPLTKITELPLSMVKIDKQFTRDMMHDQRSLAVVQALLGLGRALSLDVVAEGVETEAEAEALRDAGCLIAQGYLWSRAVTPARFLAMLDAESESVRALGARGADGDVTPVSAPVPASAGAPAVTG